MKDQEKEISSQLILLQNKVEELISFFNQHYNYDVRVNAQWSAKDVLGHLTFWHESFARNLKDLADGIKPNPFKGTLSMVNERSVRCTRECSIKELQLRLDQDQKIINENIFNNAIEMIPYKKGSRDYSRLEHLIIVENHIAKHLKELTIKIG